MKNERLRELMTMVILGGSREKAQFLRSMLLIVLIFSSVYLRAADGPRSVALKDSLPQRISFRFKSDLTNDRLWDAFMTMKKANTGDPVAEHELGLRYLLGKGFSADTEKAAQWIHKAADQNLVPAQYNFGILLNNGLGIEWNPFEAYRRFKYAAVHDMIEAQYVFGLLLTDNLVVPRNYPEAYRWIKVAADSGYDPAKEVLLEFKKRGINIFPDSAEALTSADNGRNTSTHSQPGGKKSTLPQPIDPISVSDSDSEPDNQTLTKEAILEGGIQMKSITQNRNMDSLAVGLDSVSKRCIIDAAEGGSPEALTCIGRWYEQGIEVRKDLLQATFYYLRAVRLESPWAPRLLWKLIKRKEYFIHLKTRIDENDPIAQFAWAGLIAFGFDNQLTETQSLELLRRAATQNFSPALVELGLCYYAGSGVKQDREKAAEYLRLASRLGNREATIRLSMIEVTNGGGRSSKQSLVDSLRKAADNGSVLAQEMLGYCYQKGFGAPYNKSESIRLYREAAQRGSTAAYNALRNLYDEIRPRDPEFQLPDKEVMNFLK